ncbi:MAG: cytochrome c [Rhizobiales bacterium]|nr:cytochrome c [Hyphomicrobiales bacterium]
MHEDRRLRRAGYLLLIYSVAFVAFPVLAAEDDDAAIEQKLGTCVACHGADGIGKAPQYPNLQGQKGAYLEKQLKAFRSGERKDASMTALAAGLSDKDIADLSTYFEQVK